MSEEKEFWRKGCISMVIWMGCGIVSSIVVPQITGKTSTPLLFANFGFPALVILLTDKVFEIFAGSLALVSLFSKSLREKLEKRDEPNKLYGAGAIPIALIMYGTLGWICSFFWPEEGAFLIKSHLIIGLVWSCFVYFLFQKGYFGDWNDEEV